MKPVFFPTPREFRKWLEENHEKESFIHVGYYRVDSGKPSITWSESVDEALCFGWIDGVRNKLDEESYCIRFTPRNPGSNWSTINIKKAEELISSGKMMPSGLKLYNNRKIEKTSVYSYESLVKKFSGEFEKSFRANPYAWEFYNAQPPSYRKMIVHWVMSAKQEITRKRRFEKLVSSSEKKIRLY
jgi:uncharacterized protein YdeI (YjbR/CyaY-like superfamily)